MFQASIGNMYSPVGRRGIVNGWGGNHGASNSVSPSSRGRGGGNHGASNFVSPSSRVRRGRQSSGRSSNLIQQQSQKEESEDTSDVKKLENELREMRKDKEALKRKFGQLEELLKIKEGELATAVAENNKFKVEKDFEVQFDKSWKENYETQIRNLKVELETLRDKKEPASATGKSPNTKKNSPIVKKNLTNVIRKFASVKKKIVSKKSPIAKKKLANAIRKLILVEKSEPQESIIKCSTCDMMFKTAGLLRRHMRIKHSSVIFNTKKAGEDLGSDTTGLGAVEIDNHQNVPVID